MTILNIGLIGCGGIVQWGERGHIPAIRSSPNARLVMVCDVDEDKARKVADPLNIPYTTDRRDVLKRGDIAAVIVAVPHKYHKEITVDACNSQKHVLCEKPLAMDLAEVDEMSEAADRNRVGTNGG